jgi:hypothetical protein
MMRCDANLITLWSARLCLISYNGRRVGSGDAGADHCDLRLAPQVRPEAVMILFSTHCSPLRPQQCIALQVLWSSGRAEEWISSRGFGLGRRGTRVRKLDDGVNAGDQVCRH